MISEDRDFARQAQYLARQVIGPGEGRRFLELFAGPARHSIELTRAGFGSCIAVDASPAMRAIATGPGGLDRDSYRIARLPDLPSAPDLGGLFDAASVLRYSAGYLTPLELHELLRRLASALRPRGRVVFELHDLDLLRADFRDLEIRDRVVRMCDGRLLRCIWPAAPLRWATDDWVVEMEVVVQRLDGSTLIDERKYVSR